MSEKNPESPQTPFRSPAMRVRPEWIDYNGHLNLAYYHVLFDEGADALWASLGLGPQYRRDRAMTTYAAEAHIWYMRELYDGHEVNVTVQIIDFDDKRMHVYQELFHADGWQSAAVESLILSIDMTGPKVRPWPADILANIEAQAARDAAIARPDRIGRGIAIRRKP